jgi:hypothetical protein
MDKKSLKVYIILIAVVVAIVLIITYLKSDGDSDEKTIQCIADNSILIVKEGCSACAYQKSILGGDLSKFNVTDCAYETQRCAELGIEHIPTWIIDGEKYEGAQSIEQLKNLTGC